MVVPILVAEEDGQGQGHVMGATIVWVLGHHFKIASQKTVHNVSQSVIMA